MSGEKEAAQAKERDSVAKKAKWIPLVREYKHEREQIAVTLKPTKFHPLLPKAVLQKAAQMEKKENKDDTEVGGGGPEDKKIASDPLTMLKSSAVSSSVMDDPLSMMKKSKVDDPLRMFSQQKAQDEAAQQAAARQAVSDPLGTATIAVDIKETVDTITNRVPFEYWKEKKSRILQKYTTSKTIAVSASFLEEEVEKKVVAVDHVKSRLEELEVEQGADSVKNFMTQKEYIAHIEEQHERLKNAWDGAERVLALKIAIQCAKLLGDTSVPQFYPSMYVLLTDILDTFGELVFQRIKRKGVDMVGPGGVIQASSLPDDFKQSDVSQSAKETCRNWFYKTACIRELMPRLYIDLAMLKAYRFLEDPEKFPGIIARLARTIRGVGDPLVATYARCYLTKKTSDIHRNLTHTEHVKPHIPPPVYPQSFYKSVCEVFDDFMYSFRQIKTDDFTTVACVAKMRIGADEYVDLFSPALEWMLQNVGFRASEAQFFALLQQYKEFANNSAILVHILAAFDPAYVSNHALSMTKIMKDAQDNSIIKKSKLYLTLGECLIRSSPPKNQQLEILNDVWKVVTKIQDPKEYMEIATVFVQYLLLNFSEREVNIFLKDVIKHVKKDQAYKELQELLETLVKKLVLLTKDVHKTLAMDNFLPVLDLLERQAKVSAAKVILVEFSKHKSVTADPVIIHTLFDVARALHDSIDSLSFEDERRQIALLIVYFVRKIDYGRDLEQQLNIYVECRQAFRNLDTVITELTLRVALLTTRAHKFMKGKHTKRTAAFVKACFAYCHITIPSIEDIFSRLYLLLQCGEVALMNQMIVQSEAFLKATISLIPTVPPVTLLHTKPHEVEADLVLFVRDFAAFLLLFPGHPQNGPFYLVNGLINAVNKYEPWKSAQAGKVRVYLGLLALLCTYAQRNFPYHIDRVESNDSLYGNQASYLDQLDELLDTVIKGVLDQLTEIGARGDAQARKDQGGLALEFVNLIVSSLTMNPHSATLVVKLYQLAQGNQAVEPAFLANTYAHISQRKGVWYQDIVAKLTPPPHLADAASSGASGHGPPGAAASTTSVASSASSAHATPIAANANPLMSSTPSRVSASDRPL